MTDLEMTRLAAEAMGYMTHSPVTGRDLNEDGKLPLYVETPTACKYNPLHDDAQAMALVKRFGLNIGQTTQGVKVFTTPLKGGFHEADNPDLNYAIVECVAKMQAAK